MKSEGQNNMMKLEQSNDLRGALVLIKCSKNQHNDCRAIRDALFKKFIHIQEAYTTDVEIDNQKWCVAASALIPSNETEQFKKELSTLDADESDIHVTLDDLRVFVDKQ